MCIKNLFQWIVIVVVVVLLVVISGLVVVQSSVMLYGCVGGGIDYMNKIVIVNGIVSNLQYGGN